MNPKLLTLRRAGADYFVCANDAPQSLSTNPSHARYFYRECDVDDYIAMVKRGRAHVILRDGESFSIVEAPPNDWD